MTNQTKNTNNNTIQNDDDPFGFEETMNLYGLFDEDTHELDSEAKAKLEAIDNTDTEPTVKEEILMQDDETGEWYPVEIEATDDNDDDEEIDESGHELTEEQQAELEQQFQEMELEWQVAQMEQEKYFAEQKAIQDKQAATNETAEQAYSQPYKNLMSVTEVAAMVNRAPATVRQTILRGALPAQKIGKQWIIFKSDALKFWQDKN